MGQSKRTIQRNWSWYKRTPHIQLCICFILRPTLRNWLWGRIRTKLSDKREYFNISIEKFSFICKNICVYWFPTHIVLCFVFFVLCTICYQFLWIVLKHIQSCICGVLLYQVQLDICNQISHQTYLLKWHHLYHETGNAKDRTCWSLFHIANGQDDENGSAFSTQI
jgi:hypothetical protein